MHKLGRLSVFILLLTLFSQANAQRLRHFTHDSVTYIEEMDEFFSRSETRYKTGKELLEKFEESWLTGQYSTQERETIYELSDLLLKKRARNFPHFYDFLTTLMIIKNSDISESNYQAWQNTIKEMASDRDTRLNHIQSIFVSTQALINNNTVYYSSTVKWFADNSNYKIRYENDTLKIIFDEVNLTCKMRNDSIQIFHTSGTYYPLDEVWKGGYAKITWEKAGLAPNIAYAEVDKYTLEMNRAYYTIPNARFYNKNYFEYALTGKVSDKVVEYKGPESISYPRFESDKKQFVIKDIFNGIDYKGGFSMHGDKFIGTGTKGEFATVSLYRDTEIVQGNDTVLEKRLFMQTSSLYYSFNRNEIISRNAKICMYIDNDSIYHPGLLFRYYNHLQEVNLIRDNDPENMSRSPYYNSYHKIEMDFELLRWNMAQPIVDMTMLRGSSINVANFESANYFSAARYYEVQGLEDVHPYVSLRRYALKNDTETFHVEDFSKYLRLPLTITRRLLIELTYRGIVDFNFETGYCKIKPKLYYYLEAIVGRRDYDLITLESRINAPQSNASLNLKNMDLAINGVPLINLSDSQNVIFYPKNQQILMKKNRDFDFSGRIEAGYFNYYGENFEFKYDSFKIALNQVDSLTIKVKAGVDNWGRKILENVESVVENVTGDLAIDDPGNKSGVKHFPEYPVFESRKESYVYYDDPDIQKGKYIRDRFYFIVDPYVIDSLNSFSTEGMGYEGRLISADIFPVIEQKLVLQPDNSLGFVHQTPEEGLPLFKGKGVYKNEISLNNQGLRGDGEMTYLTSNTSSDDFIFFPDSTNAVTTRIHINKQISAVQYPEVRADKVYMHWMPYLDEMHLSTLEEPMVMYENKAKHTGTILYTPKEMNGGGTMAYYKSKLSSGFFDYNADRFSADTADFTLASVNADKIALSTTNLNAKVDFNAMKSEFKSNDETAEVDLPETNYLAYIEKFSWLMNDKTMSFSTPNTVQVYEYGETREISRQEAGMVPKGSLYISKHHEQDSLNWISPNADYNLATNTLFAHNVKFIQVADATVFPSEGEVTVDPNAKMRTLTKAEVLANTETKYHTFNEATINIISRNSYHGEGKYDYMDEMGRVQKINFDVIAVDSTLQTYAKGKIKGIKDFTLSQAFGYQGDVFLEARKEFLYFDGYTRINHECDDIQENWLKFDSDIDPNNIYIPLAEQPMDINDKFLVSGVMLATDSIHVFPAFVSPRKRYSNIHVSTATGYLHYSKPDKKYQIGSKAKINDIDTIGNFLSLHKNYCTLYGEGDIDLTANLGQVKLQTKGNAMYELPEDKLTLDLLMTMDFYFPPECIAFISDTLATMTALPAIDLEKKSYIKALRTLIGYKNAEDYFKEQSVFGTVKKIPEELSTTFVFSDFKLVWNKSADAWQSEGKLGIANIMGNEINKKFSGHLEIQRKRSGDNMTLYIEISENHWYYFNYNRGLMQAYSSEAAFNEIITNIKGKDRKLKVERGEPSYVFFLSNMGKKNKFLERMGGKSDSKADEDIEDIDYEQFEEFD